MNRRVAVTGMSGVTALGNDWPTIRARLLEGRTGIKRMNDWDRYSGLNTRLAAPVDNRLFFAGEACSEISYSTAHGALITGRAAANETPIGYVPTPGSMTLDGLNISRGAIDELLKVDPNDWAEELDATGKFFDKFGKRLPEEIRTEHDALAERLQRVSVAPK